MPPSVPGGHFLFYCFDPLPPPPLPPSNPSTSFSPTPGRVYLGAPPSTSLVLQCTDSPLISYLFSKQYHGRGYDDYGRDSSSNYRDSSANNQIKQEASPSATVDKIDEYLELLYGSMKDKISGTASIVQLARDAGNLEILSSDNSLMSALARVLKEDYKHNIGLSTNIMYIWFSFSNFSQLHDVLTSRRIGRDTIKVIDLEIRRERLRQRELQTKTRIANIQARGGSVPEKLWEELAGGGKGKDGVIVAGSKEDHPIIDIEHERKMTKHLIRKQDKLLFVCFTFFSI